VGWAIQKGPKELKAEAHGPRLRVRKRLLGFRRVVFHVGISSILRVSLETQIAEVPTSKSEDEQRDQE